MPASPPRNELALETSPYLLQHQFNPVHWKAWGEAAFEEAARLNKPVIVSIGYSACHWCHVMEHETFEDVEAAAFMNEHFVCVKVDREERPDVDQVYMDAVQLMTQRGGWPLNCVAMPDGRPIWGGTYFPRAQWLKALEGLVAVWQDEPETARGYADRLSQAVQALHEAPLVKADGETSEVDKTIERLMRQWQASWDPNHGGQLGAPKFPLPAQASLLLRWSQQPGAPLTKEARSHALRTLEGIEQGGIHDHVGGGFARYSVDGAWHVPHFEKMLYDNGQMLAALADAHEVEARATWVRAMEGTVDWILREMDSASGGFHSAMDADSDGSEGAYYVWRDEDLVEALPERAFGRMDSTCCNGPLGRAPARPSDMRCNACRTGVTALPRKGASRAWTTRSSPGGPPWRRRDWRERGGCWGMTSGWHAPKQPGPSCSALRGCQGMKTCCVAPGTPRAGQHGKGTPKIMRTPSMRFSNCIKRPCIPGGATRHVP